MDSQKMLLLSHALHTQKTHAHTILHYVVPDDDGDKGEPPGERDIGPTPEEDTIDAKIRRDLKLSEFYSLATRILDGDDDSLDKLVSLKRRWERRFPEPTDNRVGLSAGRRFMPRFPSRVTLMPRRSIQQS
ncbi:UNVERIFIED_CONTAM: hypothetical protein Slati_0876700 [Sesamum latifolium]|uniref:Uncharacterized protein n=1 Tax=Sesamum latifolium TaxID=2727402 RepID=A0AAW2XP86_9LAMI